MTVRLLQFSDLEYAFDDPERVARLAGRIAERRDERTLVVDTGDALGPSVLGLAAGGEQALTFYEHVRPTAAVVGNHDLDHGVDAFRSVVEASPMPWLGANLHPADDRDGQVAAAGTDSDATVDGDDPVPGVEPWILREVGDATVGIVGVTTPLIGDIATGDGLEVTDPAAVTRRATGTLRERGVDLVVVCAHAGEAVDEVASTAAADVVLGGHVHEARIDRIDGTLVTRPGNGGSGLVEVRLREAAEPTAFRHPVDDAPVDDELLAALRDHESDAGLAEVVATVEDPIPVDRSADLAGESRIGNFLTDAYRWATDADVAVLPPGGVRTIGPLVGDLTVGDLFGLTPFDQPLCVAPVTGDRLRELVEELALVHYPEAPPEQFGHVSGMTVEWDDDADRAVSVTVDGAPVDDETYTVALSRFFVDSENVIRSIRAEDVRSEHEPGYEAVVAYAREHGVDPELEGRIRRV